MHSKTQEEFEQSLVFGRIGESKIHRWLCNGKRYAVLPIYNIEEGDGKGPRLFTTQMSYVTPDILAIKKQNMLWFEAKRKSVFSWYRKHKRWTTGIDVRHFNQYKLVSQISGLDVVLLFLHEDSVPSKEDRDFNCPKECPTGLYGGSLSRLKREDVIDHTYGGGKYGKGGMVYWAEDVLKQFATLEEVNRYDK